MSDNIITRILKPSARGRVWQVFFVILILVLLAGVVDAPQYYNKAVDSLAAKTSIRLPRVSEVPFRLGLDLQGGTHLVYQADMSQIDSKDHANALEGVRDVIERRVNVFGVSEPIVQTSMSGGQPRIIVELAGVKDVNEAISMIGETPLLEFKESSTEIRELSEAERVQMDEFNADSDKKAEEVLGKVLSGGDFTALAGEYNLIEELKNNNGDLGWVTETDNPGVVKQVADWEVGEFSQDLLESVRGYDLYKLEDKRERANPFDETQKETEIKAAHLLLCHNEIEGCASELNKDEIYTKIKELKEQASPENFAELVKANTTEPGGADRAGELGWFSKDKMVEPFADAVFEQEVGTISYVVETQFGYHLIYKQAERPIVEYKIRQINIPKITEQDIIGDQTEWKNTELSGKHLERAAVTFNPNDSSPEVSLEFDSEGADLFAEITERNIGKGLGIFLDGMSPVDTNGDGKISPFEVYAPTVNDKISGGRAVINGMSNINEAKYLARSLNAGALPVPIDLINQQTVGASLGQESLSMSLKAGLYGLILVAIFMIIIYRLPGLLAVVSLTAYGILVMAIFKLWPVTLTLSGLAGFILSIGMAVDANVLIFERLKEELRISKPLNLAVEDAFNRAWPSIRDGNVSTLITCFILIQFTTSVVKGFAITLGLGVLISMFSAIVITKSLLKLISGEWLEKKLWLVGVKSIKN